jgi:hypothetical protein
MLPNARYPLILQPIPLGVDRRDPVHMSSEKAVKRNVTDRECYWDHHHNEKPIPILELTASYVPQTNMTWIPSINLAIAPCKVQVDVDYILRVAGVVIDAVSKFQNDSARKLMGTSSANDKLLYESRSHQNTYLTYIEQLYITPLHFQIELNIKPDGCDDDESYETLTLNALAQSIDSAFVAGVLSWLINVGSNFAHVSPSFRYKEISDVEDRYCDALDLAADLAISYIVSTIKQVSAGKFPLFSHQYSYCLRLSWPFILVLQGCILNASTGKCSMSFWCFSLFLTQPNLQHNRIIAHRGAHCCMHIKLRLALLTCL